ncbi:attractin-like protein 1 isoform X1 [Sinocyclocheilus grahami]|uniref:attractin-like protein 1 isoform X1 n=1 Tax=Sinocyclocheilus grahami TaxID=75366 RepID=UPI0007AD5C4B|nr:PREDICTED: attractin-like protein 1 isoform X1 [Sinocyclocheilus grahami]
MLRSEENRRMDFGRRRMTPRFSTRCFLCRSQGLRTYLFMFMVFYLLVCTEGSYSKTCEKNCVFGRCINGTCVCERGWAGDQCQHCQGRVKLTESSGSLTDGPVNYKYKTKCTWLIEGYPNAVLRLRFIHFATECSWDHMYVFDGDSIYAPLVAVFSGLVVPETKGNETIPEVVTTSGYALLHFFSDAAYNLTGFNIFYSINSCPNNCSGHGRCTTGNSISSSVYCECERYWKGEACDIPYCWDDCGSPDHGYCDLTGEKLCVCNDSWQGPDCSLKVPSAEPYWFLPNVKPDGQSLGRASHKAVVHGKLMWVIGGFTFNYSSFQMVINYNLESSTWDVIPINGGPMQRYGHSLALYKDDIYMFGGKLEAGSGNVTDELWLLDTRSRSWSLRTPSPGLQVQPFAVEGHTAHIVDNRNGEPIMVVLFGYSPIYSYLSLVQEYNIRTNSWSVAETNGALVQGGYGHSSIYDSSSHSIYVHGGYKALPANKYGLVDHLFRYQVHTHTWFILKESGLARYLHSTVLISGVLLVFGGNTHNDTSLSNGAKCFSSDFLSYDIVCDEWAVLPNPNLHRDVNRFGHTAVVSNGSMYVFGGFSGVILNDVLVYKPANCEAFIEVDLCQSSGSGVHCVWIEERCVPWDSSHANDTLPASSCPARTNSADKQCQQFSDCASCTANTNDCQWCEDKKCISSSSNCSMLTIELARHPRGPLYLNPPPAMLSDHQLSIWRPGVRKNGQSVKNFTKCSVRSEQVCSKLVNCRSCSLNINCQWEPQQQECHALPAHLCGEGWSQVGDACLRLNASKESYDNAQHYCKNLDGNIASLTSARQVDFILDELQKYQLQEKKLTPWVGLRKINVSYWGWEDMSPFTASTLQWLPGEPSDSGFCAYLERAEVAGLKAKPCTANTEGLICEKPVVSPNLSVRPCKIPCALRTSCANCTSQAMECMWCGSTKRCVDSNAYVISFPYGQCLEWQTGDCGAQNCSGHRTCGQCLGHPDCGWCGDPTDTGQGQCIEGSYRGAMRSLSRQSRERVLDTSVCSREKGYNWAYITCPACQCNGHSTCVNGSVCEQCKNLTTGPQCQICLPGYYGDPTNGGKCQACRCNNHANVCHSNSGKCYCTTKGVKGDQCQLCDSENRYLGNPLRGTCYYNLLIDYQFTFSLLQEDDQHYTAINFMATPEETNKNLDMSINASNNFNLNITWSIGSTAGTISGEEFPIVSKTSIKEYRDSFSCETFSFLANPNITFHVYVSNFSWPIKIQISFSQHGSIMDLVQFFVTFFSCFLSLLLVAAVVWKVKQTCWASRRREQLMRERQQMASRPFASVTVALEAPEEEEELLQGQVEAGPITVEPCFGNCAAVQTLLMSLPQASSGVPPPGQCGITIASALIDTSQQRAGDFKDKCLSLKSRKQQHTVHQGTCV